MKILSTHIDEREGSDCWLRDAYFAIEDDGKAYILRHSTVTGWGDVDEWTEVAPDRLDPDILDSLLEVNNDHLINVTDSGGDGGKYQGRTDGIIEVIYPKENK